MLTRILATAIAALFAAACSASSPTIQKHYSGQGGDWQLDATMSSKSASMVAVELSVGNPKCTGYIAGIGELWGNVLLVSPATPEPGDKCSIIIHVSESGQAMKVAESGCGFFHGAACEFRGELRASN